MTGKTHFASSILLISSACVVLNDPIHISLFAVGNLYGSLVPDIDSEYSIGKKKFVLTSKIYNTLRFILKGNVRENIFSHRGIMHSLLIPIIAFISAYISDTSLYYLFIGLFTGYISHLILDFITSGKIGLALLSPIINYRFKLPIWFRTDGIFEYITLCSIKILSIFIMAFFINPGLSVFSV